MKQDVVAGLGIERRVEIDQVYALAGDMLTKHMEVVAVIESVWHNQRVH